MIPFPRDSYKPREVEASMIAWDIINTVSGPWETALFAVSEDEMRQECIKFGPVLIMIWDLARQHNYEAMFGVSLWDFTGVVLKNFIDWSNTWIQLEIPMDTIANTASDFFVKGGN